jgi:4a-hydroxytetrahydrobiopterin dehydratase
MASLALSEIEMALKGLPDWSYEDNQLKRCLVFHSYPTAISFITRISFEAEAMNHHPIILNDYKEVHLSLTTHDESDCVTSRDLVLAEKIQAIIQAYYSPAK